jgi:hypothetical protein
MTQQLRPRAELEGTGDVAGALAFFLSIPISLLVLNLPGAILPLKQSAEDYKVVRRRSSHILHTIDSQMTVWMSNLSAGRPPFTPRKIPGSIPVRGIVDPTAIEWMDGLSQVINSMTLSRFKPGTFRLPRAVPLPRLELKSRGTMYYSPTASPLSFH